MPHRWASKRVAGGAACLLWALPAIAQTTPNGHPGSAAPSEQANPTPGQTGAGAASAVGSTGLWERANLLGDIGGLRSLLADHGISLGLSETSEVLGNVTGGVHRGAAYDGLTLMSVGVDTEKAFGLPNGVFNVSALQIHGRNLSTDNLLTIQTASGIEAERTTRLWELWYQQGFLDGKFDIKIGQQSLDQEFITSQGSSLFINTMMGWPALPSLDLYAGGPAYPLSSLGVRLRGQPSDKLTVLGGVFDDNPPGGPFADDSQLRGAERSGTRFNTGTGALFIAEVQYALNPPPSAASQAAAAASGLPGLYKLGVYYDTGSFPDQRFDAVGISLADPASSGSPLMRQGNFGIYGVMDQMLWRPDAQGARAVGVFARIMGGPGDRNLLNFALNAGITLKAPFHGRDNDSVGLGYGFARVSNAASNLDKDAVLFSGMGVPIRSSESFIELTYQAQIAPWWILQPDLQYVFTPGGGVANPLIPGQRVGNEMVLGLRTSVTF
ncbi:carbohydrate porin [Rhodopila sp.]|uniref:carbohydrate porin n=1 Tax=Rhodopila sp. TaxID=2480087 RepID=UPI003D0BE926